MTAPETRLNAYHRDRMRKQLILHEGLKLTEYRCTANKRTIGIGYNVEDRGPGEFERITGRAYDGTCTRDEAFAVLDHDIDAFETAVLRAFPHYARLDQIRKRVVLDMAFNMGFKALKFRGTIAAVIAGNWPKAKAHMLNSLWAEQVGDGEGGRFDRAERLSQMMLTGEDYTR